MSYCVNPLCTAPSSGADDARTCPSCSASLTLRERYRSLRLLGQGGFGRTFLAVDESEDSKPRCVVKQLFPQQQHERQRASRLFRQEAQRLRSLEAHSQIPDLIDYFEIDDQQYLVQEFIDGTDLAVALKSGQISSPEAVVELLSSLLPVLQFMHEHQVIHRDIKPANIIRRDRDQQLFLVDLGAAKVATGTALAQTGTTIGSAEYTAPEQLRGKAVFASDIYSLGMTCLHLLTGVSPFNLYNADEGRLVWQDYLNSPLDEQLSQVLAGMTAVATKQRYASVKDVMLELLALPGLSAAIRKPEQSSLSRVEILTSDAQTTSDADLTEHQVVKSSSSTVPVKLQVGRQKAPLSIELQEKSRTTLATPLSQKKTSFADESQTFGTALLRIFSGELPIGAIVNWLQQEAPPGLKGGLAWAAGRTALTLLLMLGIPGLFAWGLSASRRPAKPDRFAPTEPLIHSDLQPVVTPPVTVNESVSENAYAKFVQDRELMIELGKKYNGYPQPVTAISPERIPVEGTVDLSMSTPLSSIATTRKYPIRFELNETENALLVQTISSSIQAGEFDVLAEFIDLEHQQALNSINFKSYSLPQIVFDREGSTLLSQSYPSHQDFNMESLPEIQGWNWRTGKKTEKLQVNQGLFLGAPGPVLDSGESSIIGNNLLLELVIFGQETGQVILRERFDGGVFNSQQSYQSLLAAGTSEVTGRIKIAVTIFDVKKQSKDNYFTIFPSLFDKLDSLPKSRLTDIRDVSLKFDSSGNLYIGREALECIMSCLEVYEIKNSKHYYKHIPAQIPPFEELFVGPKDNQIVLYIPAYLGVEAQLQVWDMETGVLVKRVLLEKPYILTLTTESGRTSEYSPPVKLSADGTRLYTAHPGEVKVWDFQVLLEQD